MNEIELARNPREQSLEIICNGNQFYFKTIKKLFKGDRLCAFPSKDLEISLGLQYIPINSDEIYLCKKCSQQFYYQYALMIHNRYFCSFNANNLLRSILNNHQAKAAATVTNNSCLIKENSDPEITNMAKKRALDLDILEDSSRKQHIEPERFYFFEKKIKNFHQSHCVSSFNSINPATTDHSFQAILSQYSALSSNPIYAKQQNTLKDCLANYLAGHVLGGDTNQSSCKILNPFLNYLTTALDTTNPAQILEQNKQMMLSHLLSQKVNTAAEPFFPLSPGPTILNELAAKKEKVLRDFEDETKQTNSLRTADMMINAESSQNWCAKCSVSFKLTSDLVYHMRTFHKKDQQNNFPSSIFLSRLGVESKKFVLKSDFSKIYSSSELLKIKTKVRDSNEILSQGGREAKCLKCEICSEVFKEKHHLSRHMTSHR